MAKQKSPALPYSCQNKEQTMEAIRKLGDSQRELTRLPRPIKATLKSLKRTLKR